MKRTLYVKLAALCVMITIFGVIHYVRSMPTVQATDYAHYAEIEKVAQPMPTSDAVPFPTCRSSYIDLSNDQNYPIPHWVYSLPKEADKALVLAIAKNESRFHTRARSSAGAVGLMQLMPETAHYMVSQHGGATLHLASAQSGTVPYTPRSAFDFDDPYISLAVGYRYIAYLQEKPYIGENLVYTLAAYNAGPGNLRRWKERMGHLSTKQFAERIPFSETRHYVHKVLRDYERYQELIPEITETVWVAGESC